MEEKVRCSLSRRSGRAATSGIFALLLWGLRPSFAQAGEPQPSPSAADLALKALPAQTQASTSASSLQDLLQEALQRSPQVAVSQAQVAEAQGLFEIASSLAYPQGSGQVLFGGPMPEARTEVKNDITTVTEASLEGDFNFGSLGVQLRGNAAAALPLYTFGQIAKGKEAANHLVKAARHNVVATKAEVALNLTQAYWAYQLFGGLKVSLGDGQKRLEGVLEKIEELLEADSPQVTENDRLRLSYALSSLSVRAEEVAGAQAQVLQGIHLLTGRSRKQPFNIAEGDLEAAVPSKLPDVDVLISSAKNGRPEVLALGEVVEAQKSFESLRTRSFLPTFFLGGFVNFVYTSNATDQTNPFIRDPFNFVDLGIGLGMRVDLDVFTKLAQLEQAEAQTRVRLAQQELLNQAVETEIRSIYAQLRMGFKQAKELKKANRAARGWLLASTLAYDIGTGKADELIDAFLAWATSEAELQAVRFNNLMRFAQLARSAGKIVPSSKAAP